MLRTGKLLRCESCARVWFGHWYLPHMGVCDSGSFATVHYRRPLDELRRRLMTATESRWDTWDWLNSPAPDDGHSCCRGLIKPWGHQAALAMVRLGASWAELQLASLDLFEQ